MKPAVVIPKIAPARRPIAMPRRSGKLTAGTVETTGGNETQARHSHPRQRASPVAIAAPAPVTLTGWELLEQHRKTGKPIRGHVTRVVYNKLDSKSVVGIKARVAESIEGFVPFRMLGMNPLPKPSTLSRWKWLSV